MRIGQVAAETGLESSAIRYYESSEIIPTPERTPSGYRDYDVKDVELLKFVHGLRSLELPLDDVREIVALRTNGDAPCTTVREALARESENIGKRIADLTHLQSELSSLLNQADDISDDWPRSCVCHLIEPA